MPDSVDNNEISVIPEFEEKRELLVVDVGPGSRLPVLSYKGLFEKGGIYEKYNYLAVDPNLDVAINDPDHNIGLPWASSKRIRVQELKGFDNNTDIVLAKDLFRGYPQDDNEATLTAIQKFYELLKPGGEVVFIITGYTPIQPGDREDYKKKFENVGFDDVEVQNLAEASSPFAEPLNKIKKMLGDKGRDDYVVVAKKPQSI